MSDINGAGNLMQDERESSDVSFDIFSAPQIEVDMVSSKTIKVKPIAGGNTSQGPVEFLVSSAATDYTLLPFTRLEGSLKITKQDGTNLPAGADLSVVNYLPCSLWKQVECSINNTEVVDQSSGSFAFKSYLEALLCYGSEAKNTHLKTSFYYKDTTGFEDANTKTVNNGKTAYMTRQKIIEESSIVNFSSQIHVDFFNTKRLLPANCHIRLRFIRNDDSFSLIAKTGEYKIEIIPDSLSLSLRKITPSPRVLSKHEQLFASGRPAIFPFQQAKITTHLASAGTQSINFNVCTGPLPTQCFVMMVDHDAYSGAMEKNPFHFKHNGLSNFRFLVNSESYPAEYFKPIFEKNIYAREYTNLMNCLSIGSKNLGCDMDPESFASGSFILSYDSCPEMCSGSRTHLPKTGTLEIEADFKTALDKPITILVYSVYNRFLEISGKEKNCVLKYLHDL